MISYGEITESTSETRMNTDLSVQSIMGATERRRDGGTMAVVAGMVEGVLMLRVWSPESRR